MGSPGCSRLLASAGVVPCLRFLLAILALLVLGGGVVIPSARAQLDGYQGTIDAAVEEYASGNWEEALALFRQAHAVRPSARTLRGMGMASFETRRYADAIRYLAASATETARPLTQKQQHEVELLLARARAFVSGLTIVIRPADATVAVDGNQINGDMRREVLLDAGEHQLVANARGYESSVRSVQLAPGAEATLEIELSPRREAATSEDVIAPQQAVAEPPSMAGSPAAKTTRTRFGLLKYVALGATAAGLVLTTVGAIQRDRQAQRVEKGGCTSYTPDSPMAQGCHDAYESGLSWQRTTIAAAAVSGGLLASTLLLFGFDRPVESRTARLLRACQIEAASFHVRCAATF